MIKSMTGFASVTREDERATTAVTIRALNHRYLDLQVRIPQALAAIEPEVRALVGQRVARGRVELSLSLQLRQAPAVEVEFNETFGAALSAAIDQARERGLVTGALTPGDLLRLPQALTIRERQGPADETADKELAVRAALVIADALAAMMISDTRRPSAFEPIVFTSRFISWRRKSSLRPQGSALSASAIQCATWPRNRATSSLMSDRAAIRTISCATAFSSAFSSTRSSATRSLSRCSIAARPSSAAIAMSSTRPATNDRR